MFCLLDDKGKATIDPLDLSQWRFWVIDTLTLNRSIEGVRSLGVVHLNRLGAVETRFGGIPEAIQQVVGRSGRGA